WGREDGGGRRSHYVELVREVVAHAPWEPALAAEERVVIPGYASLYEFSRAQERAVKEGLGGRFWTVVHWTNWRGFFPWSREQQQRGAAETLSEPDPGPPRPPLGTHPPTGEPHHTAVAPHYPPYRRPLLEFIVYDPNEPAAPGWVAFDRADRRFFASGVYDTEPGLIRAFRMYYSPFF